MIITRRYFNALAATSAFMSSIAANRANALAWPTRPVHLVVPFAAGGPTDVIARIVGERLSKGWGQQVLIENRPGGGTNIANEMVVRSEPDGHTVLMRVRLYSRPGHDLTYCFPLIADALAKLRLRSCIIDGEALSPISSRNRNRSRSRSN